MTLADKISKSDRWLITLAVMLATLLEALDTTIVNVALPHMQGSLGAAPDQITWVLTSYLVSSAIIMPLTGYFTDRLGRKDYLIACIIGFVVTSILCGVAVTLPQLVVFRLLQGAFGAGLVPLSQAILADIYPEDERGKAMAIWGIGVMVGPVLGPTLGGYITEVANWRWNFYINIPVGLFSLLMIWRIMPDTLKKPRDMDWLGLFFLSLGIGSLQFFLDTGNQAGWFSAHSIQATFVLTVFGLAGFVIHSLNAKQGKVVFDMNIFKDSNFAISSVILAMFGLGLFGSLAILPMMLENLFQYPVILTGLVMAPRGLGAMIGMMVASQLIKKQDPRVLIIVGILLNAWGMFIGTHYSLSISMKWILWPIFLQGIGLGLIFVTLSDIAYATLPISSRTEAAGLFSLLRTIGSSIGISIVATLYTREIQIAWNQLGGFIQPYNAALLQYLRTQHLTLASPMTSTVLTSELAKQTQMLSFINVYSFVMWSFLAMIPLLIFVRGREKKSVTDPENSSQFQQTVTH